MVVDLLSWRQLMLLTGSDIICKPLIRSHLLWGEFSIFSAANTIHNSPYFVRPGTHHCWIDRGGMIWEACPTLLHTANSVTRAPVTHPSTNRARRCCRRELATTWVCPEVMGLNHCWVELGVYKLSVLVGLEQKNEAAGNCHKNDWIYFALHVLHISL